MKMKKLYKILILLSILVLSTTLFSNQIGLQGEFKSNLKHEKIEEEDKESVKVALSNPTSNYDIIEEVFTDKLSEYASLGYFSQIYEPSLQATYYAIYILEALGMLDQINQTAIVNYIMAQYNANSHIFMDKYSYRYLDTDFSQCYYPYTSVLEINCYALLSLSILGRIDLINSQDSIDFIWSCYNPEGSENGFIGQPYDSNLPQEFKISTMDNTYYALRTLNLLMVDWSTYSNEKAKIGQYILGLQSSNGGFYNDNNTNFDSLQMWEPNLLSSYYCIKSLELLNLVSSIRAIDFFQYLDSLYDNSVHYFQMLESIQYLFDIIATALGLELSDITGYTGINRNEVINFLLNNRNNLGNWDSSTYYRNHELIDTFQIIRSLNDLGQIDQLTLQEKNQISNAIFLYKHYNGFSLISNDYVSIDLIHSIVNSFKFFNRISELDIQGLYNLIDCCYENLFYCHGFSASTNFKNYIGFRSYPIEYYNLGHHQFTEETDALYNHKFDFKALNSLLKISRLDDFSLNYNLMDLVNNILNSQFLEPEFENYGAFLPFFTYSLRTPESQNISIFFEYSYYAIKTLELLVNYLDLGTIVDLSFNKAALYGYIKRNIHETDSLLYFNPQYISDLETILQDTYYMIYILKAINLFDLNKQKIKEFVLQNINYNNIKNVYYSYKISEILDFEIDFDAELTNNLVKQLYIEDLNEFYESTSYQVINQEIFRWICEMARNSELYIECDYIESIYLGTVNTITTSFSNLIFREYGQFTSVKFESDQFGILILEKQFDNSYQVNFLIPEEPEYYPIVEGTVFIYDHSEIIGQVPIFIQTSLEQIIEYDITEINKHLKFSVNISRRISSEFQAIYNSTVNVHVFKDNLYIETLNFSRIDFTSFSRFTYTYECEVAVHYYFNVTLVDRFFPNGLFLFKHEIQSDLWIPPDPVPTPINPPIKVNGIFLAITASAITAFAAVVVILSGRSIKQKIRIGEDRDVIEKAENRSQKKKYSNKKRHKNQVFFEDWN